MRVLSKRYRYYIYSTVGKKVLMACNDQICRIYAVDFCCFGFEVPAICLKHKTMSLWCMTDSRAGIYWADNDGDMAATASRLSRAGDRKRK